ncbi:response regulator [Desulfovibrio inopinatus]|uniref:response regulator n=1 Tax=Desulfovibrio inopinatus TaxID=102109 RepID=UPI0004883725|nr:response regulator transcription factor [Desulfovibrio inopinatus]
MADKRVIIVDDHPLFREGLKTMLARTPGYTVVGEAGDVEPGIDVITEHMPDIALVDISLPGGSGIELCSTILEKSPSTAVLIVSMHSKVDYITAAFQAGAKGYLVKDSAAEKLGQALEAVTAGETWMDAAVSSEVVRRLVGGPKHDQKSDQGYSALTSREQEIFRLLAEGLSTKEIAEKLFISPKTVENHRSHIMGKMELSSAVELVKTAARLGIIDLDTWAE